MKASVFFLLSIQVGEWCTRACDNDKEEKKKNCCSSNKRKLIDLRPPNSLQMIFDFSTGAMLIDGGGRVDLCPPAYWRWCHRQTSALSRKKNRRMWNMPFVCLPTTCFAVDCHVNWLNKNKADWTWEGAARTSCRAWPHVVTASGDNDMGCR